MLAIPVNKGRVVVYGGPMYSNKTNLMIMRVNDERAQQKTVIVLAWSGAARASEENSHMLCSKSSAPIHCMRTDGRELMYYFDIVKDYDVIAIDDAHFFTDLEEFVDHLVDDHHRLVLLSSLIYDKDGQLWENGIDRIFFGAEEAYRMTSVCYFCHQKNAVHTIKLVESDESSDIVDVGGEEKYQPVCRHCRRTFLLERVEG